MPAYQNTDQGGYLSSFYVIEGIILGRKFGVEVSGVDCSLFGGVGPLHRSGKRATDVHSSGYNGKWRFLCGFCADIGVYCVCSYA